MNLKTAIENYLITDDKYVIDWEQLDNVLLFKDLREILQYDGSKNAKADALLFLKEVMLGNTNATRFLSSSAIETLYDKNKKDIDLIAKDFYFKEDKAEALTYALLNVTATQINELFEANKVLFKKGWFRENANEKFYDDLLQMLPTGYTLEKFYKEIDINNRGNIFDGFNKHLARYFNDGELEKMYLNHKEAVYQNCMTTNDELSIDDLDSAMRFMVMETIAYAADKAFNEDYAKNELEFFKVLAHTNEEQKDAEAHGEFDDITQPQKRKKR